MRKPGISEKVVDEAAPAASSIARRSSSVFGM
jgi:hypothetical protein